jgi:ligand-binding sensor domain-containing protein
MDSVVLSEGFCAKRGTLHKKSLVYVSGVAIFLFFLLLVHPVPAGAAGARTVDLSAELPAKRVTALAADDRGIWVGTVGGGVALLSPSGEVLAEYGTREGLPSEDVISLAVVSGKVYAGTPSGLGVFDGVTWSTIRDGAGVLFKNVYLKGEPGGGRLWAGAVNLTGGLVSFDGRTWSFRGGEGRGLLNNVRCFAFQDGAVWLGTTNAGVFYRTDTEFRFYRDKEGLPSSSILSLEIFQGTVWAGTANGAARFERGRWTAFTRGSDFPLTAVFSLASSPEALYLGGRGGLVRYRSGRFDPFPPEGGIPFGEVFALLQREGSLYAGTDRGLFLVQGW